MRYWTVTEAREHLPRLRELVERIRHAALARTATHSGPNGQRAFQVEAQQAYDELSSDDIILRDPLTGLVDFHSRGSDGVVYYLCWRLGEPELVWWHLPEEGFPGRKPLPRDPE